MPNLSLKTTEPWRRRISEGVQYLLILGLAGGLWYVAASPLRIDVRVPPLSATVELDADGVCTSWSRGMEVLTQIPAEDALGTNLQGIIIPEASYSKHRDALRKAVATGAGVDREQLVRCFFHPQGKRRVDVLIRKRLVRLPDGELVARAEFFEVVR